MAGAEPLARAPEQIRRAIHDGLLANDVVGFHATAGAGASCARASDLLDAECDFDSSICSWRDGRTFVAARPISVDPSEFEELAESERGAARWRRSSSRAGPSS